MRACIGPSLFVIVATLVGCAQRVDEIDRTEPEAVERRIFEGDDEWYHRQTVVDAEQVEQAGGGVIFEAMEGPLHRIRWSVTEDMLLAHSTVEPAHGVYDERAVPESGRYAVVAAFPIEGHFDRKRTHDSSTGALEIVEDTSSRPWWDREYIRIDWSTNLVSDLTGIGGVGTFAVAQGIPAEADTVDPDRARISDDFIDTVTRYTFEPDVSACARNLGFDSTFRCEGGTVSVRSSFVKKGPEDYVPLEYVDTLSITEEGSNDRLYAMEIYDPGIGKVFDAKCTDYAKQWARDTFGESIYDACKPAKFPVAGRFGFFRTERMAWDPGRGASHEGQRLYYANRWNLWETMVAEDGTELPATERTPRPIVYYTNLEYPRDMWAPAQKVADEWNDALLQAVAHAQGVEADDVEATLREAGYGGRMFEIRWNHCSGEVLPAWFEEHGASRRQDQMNVAELVADFRARWGEDLTGAVWSAPHEARAQLCAELEYATQTRDVGAFTFQRTGDLRYSFFNWIDTGVPWLGYGPTATDPVTGEIVSASANIAGRTLRTVGPYAADVVQYLNGELAEEELIDGDNIRDELLRAREDRSARQSLSVEGKAELARRAGATVDEVSPTGFRSRPSLHELPVEILRFGHEAAEQDALLNIVANEEGAAADMKLLEFYDRPAVRDRLMSDPKFALMVNGAAAVEFGPDFDADEARGAYLSMTTPRLQSQRSRERSRLMSHENMCFHTDEIERAIQGLALYSGVAESFEGASREEMERFFVRNVLVGTALHEVGHTLGLRHNFAGSSDALNYRDEYWSIRRAVVEGKIDDSEQFHVPSDLVDEILGEQAADVRYLSEAELRLSTVMDYASSLPGPLAGIGRYDEAAINFAYGEVVERWVDDDVLREDFGIDELDSHYQTTLWVSDYREIPLVMGAVTQDEHQEDPNAELRGIEMIQDAREYVPIDVAIAELRDGIIANSELWESGRFSAGKAKPRFDRTVPYAYCDDSYRGLRLGCDAMDWGSNQREIVNHQFDTYRLFQPFMRYSRGHVFRHHENVAHYQRWLAEIFRATQGPFRHYAYYQWMDLGPFTNDLREASIDALNFYAEVIATPEPYRFCSDEQFVHRRTDAPWWADLDNTYLPGARPGCSDPIDIPRGPAQFYDYDLTDDYELHVRRVGTYVDKIVASQALFRLSGQHVHSSFFTDVRAGYVSFWSLFKDEMLDYLRAVLLYDYAGFAGGYDRRDGRYVPPRIVDRATFGAALAGEEEALPRVFTPMSITHELNFLVGGMAFDTRWHDRQVDFAQYVKLAVANDELQPFPDDTEIHEFVHPITNQVYVAAQTQDGKSIAVELVALANENLVYLREAKERLDTAEPGSLEHATAREVYEYRSEGLEEIVARLDMVREVWRALGAESR